MSLLGLPPGNPERVRVRVRVLVTNPNPNPGFKFLMPHTHLLAPLPPRLQVSDSIASELRAQPHLGASEVMLLV